MTLRNRSRLGGFLIFLIAVGLTAIPWYEVFHYRYYHRYSAISGPAFIIIGLAMIILPTYREERIARGEDISKLQGIALITPRWWLILVVGFIVGCLNWFLVSRYL